MGKWGLYFFTNTQSSVNEKESHENLDFVLPIGTRCEVANPRLPWKVFSLEQGEE